MEKKKEKATVYDIREEVPSYEYLSNHDNIRKLNELKVFEYTISSTALKSPEEQKIDISNKNLFIKSAIDSLSLDAQIVLFEYRRGIPIEKISDLVGAPYEIVFTHLIYIAKLIENYIIIKYNKNTDLGSLTKILDKRYPITIDNLIVWGYLKRDIPAEPGSFPEKYDPYDQMIRSLEEKTRSFKKQIANEFMPALKSEMLRRNNYTYEEKKDLVKWVNSELRRFELSIKSPHTGNPSLFKANPGKDASIGRFQLVSVNNDGIEKTFSSTSIDGILENLELMDAPQRRESIVEWQEKVGQKRGGLKRN